MYGMDECIACDDIATHIDAAMPLEERKFVCEGALSVAGGCQAGPHSDQVLVHSV